MYGAKSLEVKEDGKLVGFDVAYGGASHRLMIGESYESGTVIKTQLDAESEIKGWVDAENERRKNRVPST